MEIPDERIASPAWPDFREANHPDLTTQKTLYVEISRARQLAELVTDDRERLREHRDGATGERIAALERVEPGAEKRPDPGRVGERERERIDGPRVEDVMVPESDSICVTGRRASMS